MSAPEILLRIKNKDYPKKKIQLKITFIILLFGFYTNMRLHYHIIPVTMRGMLLKILEN